jgi:hypothetical protein
VDLKGWPYIKGYRTNYNRAQGCQIIDAMSYPNVPNQFKMYQMVIKLPQCSKNIPNGHTTYQHFPIYVSKALKNLPKLGFLVGE